MQGATNSSAFSAWPDDDGRERQPRSPHSRSRRSGATSQLYRPGQGGSQRPHSRHRAGRTCERMRPRCISGCRQTGRQMPNLLDWSRRNTPTAAAGDGRCTVSRRRHERHHGQHGHRDARRARGRPVNQTIAWLRPRVAVARLAAGPASEAKERTRHGRNTCRASGPSGTCATGRGKESVRLTHVGAHGHRAGER